MQLNSILSSRLLIFLSTMLSLYTTAQYVIVSGLSSLWQLRYVLLCEPVQCLCQQVWALKKWTEAAESRHNGEILLIVNVGTLAWTQRGTKYHPRINQCGATLLSFLLIFLLLGLEGLRMLQCWTVFTSRLQFSVSAGLPTAGEWPVLSISHSSQPPFPSWPSNLSFYPPRCVSDWILSAS